jgi:signal transduction histidine kinase
MPVLFALVCWVAYSFTATRSNVVRGARAERERLAAQLEAERAARARERLARDLHDSVGSSLSLASVYGDLLDGAPDDEAAERLRDGLAQAAEQSLDDLRQLLEGLEHEGGTEGDLTEIVQARAERLAGPAGVEVSVRASGAASFGAAARFAVLRITDEAIANALRHAGARRIDVEIACEPRQVRVVVADDGRGITASDDRRGHGLRNMRARAEELGGTLVVSSGPDGTQIDARVPAPSH